jgi:uncharacterized membrane protein YkvA (DUF1232 family)
MSRADHASAFDPAAAIPRGRALTPAIIRVNEQRVARGFWPKLRRVARLIPFAREVVALYYCAADPQTPVTAKAMVMAALAYFVLPTDTIPDFIAGIGYTDDAAVIAAVIALVGRHLKPAHKDAAQAFLDRLARDT